MGRSREDIEKRITSLTKEREALRKEDRLKTDELKKLRAELTSCLKESIKSENSGFELQLRESQANLRALRIAASKALKDRGAKVKEIEAVLGVTYGMVKSAQIRLEREARRAAREDDDT